MAVRGCGSRQGGGIYACTFTGTNGWPLEHYVIDPPMVVDPESMGLSAVGVHPVKDKAGVTHLFDIVGAEHYPNVADYLEETRRLGASRRVPSTLPFGDLTGSSRLVLIHSRAYIDNWVALRASVLSEGDDSGLKVCCPHNYGDMGRIRPLTHPRGRGLVASWDLEEVRVPGEEPNPTMCGCLWYEDVDGYRVTPDEESILFGERAVIRRMPGDFDYLAHRRPAGFQPEYQHAIFLSLPIHALQVVQDHEQGTHIAKAATLRSVSNITVEVVPE